MLHFPWILWLWFCALYAYNSQQFWELSVCTAIFLNYAAHLTEGRNTRGPMRQERIFCRSGALHSTTIAHWSLHFTFLPFFYVTDTGVQLCWEDSITLANSGQYLQNELCQICRRYLWLRFPVGIGKICFERFPLRGILPKDQVISISGNLMFRRTN